MTKPDWSLLDTVLLDMDGTLLDLHYDNQFWTEYLPAHLAAVRGVAIERIRDELAPTFRATRATLDFYCLDFWSERTGVDIPALKRDIAHLIDFREDAQSFLAWARREGLRVLIVTNAHAGSWRLKHERTGVLDAVDELVSAHDFGLPKEHPEFWAAFTRRHAVSPGRSLFVDDNLDVVRTARDADVARVFTVRQPDSRQAPRALGDEPALQRFAEIMP